MFRKVSKIFWNCIGKAAPIFSHRQGATGPYPNYIHLNPSVDRPTLTRGIFINRFVLAYAVRNDICVNLTAISHKMSSMALARAAEIESA